MNRGEELLNKIDCSNYTRDDFMALAMTCLDQANVPLNVYRVVAKTLNVELCRQCSGVVPDEDGENAHPLDVDARDSGYCGAKCAEEANDTARDAHVERQVDEACEARAE